MTFHWWWILILLLVIWVAGWLVTVIFGVFFHPLDSEEDRRKDFAGRLKGQAIINWFLWPWMLPTMLERRRFNRDIQTGKRPGWLVLADGEQSACEWKLSDGSVLSLFVSHVSSPEASPIWANSDEEPFTRPIEYRVRKLAPTEQPPTDWARLGTNASDSDRDPDNDEDYEEDEDEDPASHVESSVKLTPGKYQVDFRVLDRSGKAEESPALTMIVMEPDEDD